MDSTRFAQPVAAHAPPGGHAGDGPACDAGDFDAWLRHILASFQHGQGASVPCGSCRGCCSASHFVPVTARDTATAIPRKLLFHPSGARGPALLGYDKLGRCVLLKAGNCSIYQHRPSACRDFDCRVFAAAGITAGGREKAEINARVAAWRFQYASPEARRRHQAIQAAAQFLTTRQHAFPGGRVPTQPEAIAVVAIKVHAIFLDEDAGRDIHQTAARIVAANNAVGPRSDHHPARQRPNAPLPG